MGETATSTAAKRTRPVVEMASYSHHNTVRISRPRQSFTTTSRSVCFGLLVSLSPSMSMQHLTLSSIKGEKSYVVLIQPLNDDADESGIDSRAPSSLDSGKFWCTIPKAPPPSEATNSRPSLFPSSLLPGEDPGLFSLGTRGGGGSHGQQACPSAVHTSDLHASTSVAE